MTFMLFTHCMYFKKLIKEANLPDVTLPDLWNHFRTVSVPTIQQCQAVKDEETYDNPIVHCVMKFAEYCQNNRANSEVWRKFTLKYIPKLLMVYVYIYTYTTFRS